jgi:hypothetical protein
MQITQSKICMILPLKWSGFPLSRKSMLERAGATSKDSEEIPAQPIT